MRSQLYSYFLPSSDVTKFFGCELGAQTQFDFKNDRYIVNGVHDAAKLQVRFRSIQSHNKKSTTLKNPDEYLLTS